MRLAIIVPFQNEEEHMGTFLTSIAAQRRAPDLLVLVDDGSTDSSPAMAEAFARDHSFTRVLHREPRPPSKDRLAAAHELRAFHWALEQLTEPYDVIAKVDADLRLVPDHLETVLAAFESNPKLGVAGTYLSAATREGPIEREHHPADHVRGPNKFYREACLRDISPLPEILGWDTFDDIRAREAGWVTQSLASPSGDSIHLRPTGTHDGRLRAYRRWGRCAWGWGAHPLYVILGGVYRTRQSPRVIGGLAYVWGYVHAALTKAPQVDGKTRAFARQEEKARMRALISRRAGA